MKDKGNLTIRLRDVFQKSGAAYLNLHGISLLYAIQKEFPDIDCLELKHPTVLENKTKGSFYNSPIMPECFEWLTRSIIDAIKPSNILVPYATGPECDLFDDHANVEYYFFDKYFEIITKLFRNINPLDHLPEKESYDLIFSALPLESFSNTSIPCQIVEKTAKLVSDTGYCVFSFAKSFISGVGDSWLSHLAANGLFCVAVIDMPMGVYAPHTMIDTVIVIFSKHQAEKRFVALLSEQEYADIIVDNFLKKKDSKNNTKLGIFIEGENKCYSDYANYIRRQSLIHSLEKAYNGTSMMIKDIGIVYAPNKNSQFEERENTVYIPKLGTSPVVTMISEFQIKAQNYFQVVVDASKVLPRFLAFMLNTEDGFNIRQLAYKGSVIKALNKKTLNEMVVPCPSIELQSEFIKTYDQLESLRVDVEKLKNRLQKIPASYKNIRKEIKNINNTGDKFSQWIETLPYPISTVLKRYSVAVDPRDKQEILFLFFEAYSIFEATLLSAALNKNLIDCSILKEVDPTYFEKAAFGSWVRMDRTLSNLFLGIINSADDDKKKVALECFKTHDENLIKLLCNKKVCNVLDEASNLRNLWKGHSGITGIAQYKDHAYTLGSKLTIFQENIKDLYERIRLIRSISLSFSNGEFNNTVEILTGSNSIFQKETFKSIIPLDESKLYLQLVDTGEVLELPPYFIMKNSPENANNACYFYNRIEEGNSRYISYHFDGKPEEIEAGEIAFEHIQHMLKV